MLDLLGELSGEDDLGDLADLCTKLHNNQACAACFNTGLKGNETNV